MKIAHVKLRSLSPYSQSRRFPAKADQKLGHDEYERQAWRERMHVNGEGKVFIPPMAFKRSLDKAAAFLRMRIKEKGTSEYGKHFKAGVLVPEGLNLGIRKEDVEGEWLYLNSKGRAGGSLDVQRCMPLIPEWAGKVVYYVLDDTITKEVFEKHLQEAGNFIGIGRFRPENGGFYGRYEVLAIEWEET